MFDAPGVTVDPKVPLEFTAIIGSDGRGLPKH